MGFLAKDLIESDFIRVAKETTALEAARAMKAKKRGYVLAVSEDGAPQGVATEWDFLSKVIAEGRDPSATKMEEIMSTDLVTVGAGDPFDDISRLMVEKGVRRVIVLDDGRVLGIITAKIIISKLKDYVDKVSFTIARMQPPFM
jgi:signal-transduction protein with cAMP-binding, CBS, and nucleotidyltransferase domain